jgi:hypothetical protein
LIVGEAMTDKWGCKADYENELAAEAERQRHDNGECEGTPRCGYHLDEEENQDEKTI